MKVRAIWFAVLSCFLVLVFFFGGQGRARSQSKNSRASSKPATNDALSVSEKDLLNEINEMRAHPDQYVTYLEGLKPFFKDKEYRNGQIALLTQEGWGAVEDAIKFLSAAKPQPPLVLSQGLRLAATSHVKDQSATGATGHNGAGNTMIEDRVKPFGSWSGGIGENLSYGNESARDRILTWLIDDGFPSRGHRKRLLSPDYKVAGVSCGPHPEYGAMCVLTLAGGFTDIQAAKSSTSSKPTTPKKKKTKSRPM